MLRILTGLLCFIAAAFLSLQAYAQSNQYSRKKSAKAADLSAPVAPGAKAEAKADSKADDKSKPAADSDKLDISDLEKKYWAPKDTDFSVVQNRTYTKEKRFTLSVLGGESINDLYTSGLIGSVSANYFFNERMGVQFNYDRAYLGDSKATNAFLTTVGAFGGVAPDYNRTKASYTVGFNFVPFYAKMSFLSKKIIYFDMAFTPVIGMTEYDQVTQSRDFSKTALTYGLDISQFYFLANWFAVRVDLKNRWSNQEILVYKTADRPRNDNFSFTTFQVGVMFLFGSGSQGSNASSSTPSITTPPPAGK